MNNEPVIVEQTLNAPVEKVWKSITEADLMRQWFFDNIESFIPELGFATHFDVNSKDTIYQHLWKIIDVINQQKITIEWRYGGFTGDSTVTFELFPEKNMTKLILTHEGIESFPQDNPDFSRESCRAGWNYIIGTRLKDFIEKR